MHHLRQKKTTTGNELSGEGTQMIQRQTKNNVVQMVGNLNTVETIRHYINKVPDFAHLLTSFRRQQMLLTTTLIRDYITHGTGALQNVNVALITEVHETSTGPGSKTQGRINDLQRVYPQAPANLTRAQINAVIPSVDDIVVAQHNNRYVSLQGVGRIRALKDAWPNNRTNIQVEVRQVNTYLIAALEYIANLYNGDEGIAGRVVGTALSALLMYLGFKSVPLLVSVAKSLLNKIWALFG